MMEKKMETTLVSWGFRGINGKQNGNCYSILGLYREQWKIQWKLL